MESAPARRQTMSYGDSFYQCLPGPALVIRDVLRRLAVEHFKSRTGEMFLETKKGEHFCPPLNLLPNTKLKLIKV